jgi:hypothetical protein
MAEPTKYPLADLVEALSIELREAHRRASSREDGPAFNLDSATAELAIGWETNKEGGIDFQVFKLGGTLTRNNTSTLSVTIRPTGTGRDDPLQRTLGPSSNPEGYAIGFIASDRVGRVIDVPDPFAIAPETLGFYQPILEALWREAAGLTEQLLIEAIERLADDRLTTADWRPSKGGPPIWHGRVKRAVRILRDLGLVVWDRKAGMWSASNAGVAYLRWVHKAHRLDKGTG